MDRWKTEISVATKTSQDRRKKGRRKDGKSSSKYNFTRQRKKDERKEGRTNGMFSSNYNFTILSIRKDKQMDGRQADTRLKNGRTGRERRKVQ